MCRRITFLLLVLFWSFVHIKLEVAFFDSCVREYHLSISMLNTLIPFTLIDTSISPFHFTIAISLIFLIFTFVDISTSPGKNSIALLFICYVVSLVLIALWPLATLPSTLTML